ncbi:MAG: transcription repressor NadR [Lachnospiraceae bacterium]|nr:transcription repressor NadR [Lachnospiraceae bacterium]
MKIKERHKALIDILKRSKQPVPGSSLAKETGVSRQIIIKDIERLKGSGYKILSTPKGYLLDNPNEVTKVFKVYHIPDDIEKELNMLVDLGAEVKDVFIYHHLYNEVHAPLNIHTRKDVADFCEQLKSGRSEPLSNITGGYHYHTIVTKDAATMELVEKALKDNGFLAKLREYEPGSLYDSE